MKHKVNQFHFIAAKARSAKALLWAAITLARASANADEAAHEA